MLWINFLHLYQPINSDSYIIKEAVDLSYKNIIEKLEKNNNFKVTLNISACLVLRLVELNYLNLISRINKLIEKKQIELVGSAAYHPILPIISENEVIFQVKENKKIIKKYFPKAKLNGFFLPEMAYSDRIAIIIKKLGYRWLILDEISYNNKQEKIDFNQVYNHKKSDLKIIFRSREYSNCYTPLKILEYLDKNKNNKNKIVISANDAELYGLRHNDNKNKLQEVLNIKLVKSILISDYIKNKKTVNVDLRASNWESSQKELKNNDPYHLWFNKNNIIHSSLWAFTFIAEDIINKHKKDKNYNWARWHFVRGLASCTFWWASNKDFKHNFGPIAWNPDMIERGANEFIRSVRSLENSTTREEKIKAEHLFISIKKLIWTKHWS